MSKWIKAVALLSSISIFLAACSSQLEQIEVTRVVEVAVPGEEVEVEVTRLVETEVDAAATDSSDDQAASDEESGEEDAFQAPSFETVEVADGVYSFGNGEVYGAFMVTDEGVIVMDSVSPDFATRMLAAIQDVTDQPIRYLIYSHNHWDHISGGQIFKDAGATVLSHVDIYGWLENHPAPNPAVVIPDETWTGQRHDVVLGGRTLELYHFGPSHGEGMTVFRFPEEQTIFTVDIVVPKRVGFAYMPDFTPRGWIATLYAIEELEFETVMFSHNAAFGPRSSVTEQREFPGRFDGRAVRYDGTGRKPICQSWAGI